MPGTSKLNTMIYAYLQQSTIYHSDSKGGWQELAKMNPVHARNAAAKLLRECLTWAQETGIETPDAALWMTAQPLFRALVERAGF